jgi:hypothetical protein
MWLYSIKDITYVYVKLFFLCRLGEVMASNNSARKDELSSLRKPAEDGFSPPPSPPRSSTNHIQMTGNGLRGPVAMDTSSKKSMVIQNRSNINEANIESLIERMKSGLEVSEKMRNGKDKNN